MRRRIQVGTILSTLFLIQNVIGQESAIHSNSYELTVQNDDPWVQRKFSKLSPRERVAQLFFVDAYSNRDRTYRDSLIRMVSKETYGGVIFFQGGPIRQLRLSNKLQSASKVPLLMAMDAEWGLGMRLDSIADFPYQMTLGAVRDDKLIEGVGRSIGKQMKRLDMHINYAPVVDINNNSNNPVINIRSFGSDPKSVADKARAFVKGMQEQGIMSTAKHFPGHGDTDIDSHLALPVISSNREAMDSVELLPFKRMINAGIGSIMVAHLEVPNLQNSSGIPTSLDEKIVTVILRDRLGFKGFTVTDALNMKGVSNSNHSNDAALKALKAGNDMLLFPEDASSAIDRIMLAIRDGEISQAYIDEKCLRILRLKKQMKLDFWEPRNISVVDSIVDNPEIDKQIRRLYAAAITLLQDNGQNIPIKELEQIKTAAVSVGANDLTPFQRQLARYANIETFQIPPNATEKLIEGVIGKLKGFDRIIIGIHSQSEWDFQDYGITGSMKNFLDSMPYMDHSIVAGFMNPYALNKVRSLNQAGSLLVTYQNNDQTQELAAQAIYGGLAIHGQLPVELIDFRVGSGLQRLEKIRLGYNMNEQQQLLQLDSILLDGISKKAFPGCQVLVAQAGDVIYQKAFGTHTYADTSAVELHHLYDLASLTKVLAPLPLLMKAYDDGYFDLDDSWESCFPLVKKHQIGELTLRDILAHRTGLPDEIELWRMVLNERGGFDHRYAKNSQDGKYSYRLSDSVYLNLERLRKDALRRIVKFPFQASTTYQYSGIPFLLFPKFLDHLYGLPFDKVLKRDFLDPLGMTQTLFNPKDKFASEMIVPTEFDLRLRKDLVHGVVHDENAFVFGGISGNAGLFANANDIAKLLQMYLNGGVYGGKRYLSKKVIDGFTAHQYCAEGNRRGLGFDKPSCTAISDHVSNKASMDSYGHSGFTGSYLWVDPEYDLIYIFLANRVYPSREQRAIYDLNIRIHIQNIIYENITDI